MLPALPLISESCPSRGAQPTFARMILLRIPAHRANQFDQARSSSKQKPDYVDPRSVQPPVEGRPEKPPRDRTRRKHQRHLAVSPNLHPRTLLFVIWIAGSGAVRHQVAVCRYEILWQGGDPERSPA